MDKTHTKESKNIKSNQKMFVVAIIYQLARIKERKKKLMMFGWLSLYCFFLFEKEKCRRRDGHQSPENEPGLLYNLRVCVSVCVYFIVITCFW
jgi:hypothetical protein